MIHVTLDRNGLDLTLHRPVQLDFDESSALDTQLPAIEQSAAIAVGRIYGGYRRDDEIKATPGGLANRVRQS